MSTRTHPSLTQPITERDHSEGSPHASVTLVEYGDFECPQCGRAFLLVEDLRKRMGERLKFVYRHFPLSEIHPHAEMAAEAAEAAGAQDKFWEMHRALFTHQAALDDSHFRHYASVIGLDLPLFSHDLENRVYQARVREDFMSGARSGVNGTPTFFINGERYDGIPLFNELLRALESAAR